MLYKFDSPFKDFSVDSFNIKSDCVINFLRYLAYHTVLMKHLEIPTPESNVAKAMIF